MDELKFDFSSLDPSLDTEHWEQLVASVTTRAVLSRADSRGRTVSTQLIAWARPSLAIAAVFALVIWGATLLTGDWVGSNIVEDHEDPAYVLASWATDNEPPPAREILRVLGAGHGTN